MTNLIEMKQLVRLNKNLIKTIEFSSAHMTKETCYHSWKTGKYTPINKGQSFNAEIH